MLTKPHRQEGLSRAYVQAITAQAGLSYSVSTPDYGIDLTLHDIGRRGNRRYPSGYKLDIQAKSTTVSAAPNADIPYDLEVKAYEDLRDPEVGCPRILVLLVLPENETQWISQTEEQLVLRHCAYWLSLVGQPSASNRRTVRVVVPRGNVFTTAALEAIMNRVKRKVAL